jgi:hypothetical protein
VGLDREQYRPVDPGGQAGREHRGEPGRELLDRPLDAQAAAADRGDDRRIGVADEDFVTITGQTCGNSPADRPTANQEVAHGAQRYNTVKAMV